MKQTALFSILCLSFLHISSAQAAVWYVDIDAPPGGNGTSWQTAFQTIQPAIDAAIAGDEVWVAEGIYAEHRDPMTGALILRGNISLYGGFAGNETHLGERDMVNSETVIDGSQAAGGSAAQHVITAASHSRLDGFVIRGAINSGIEVSNSQGLSIVQCRITGNSAEKGGGVRGSQSTDLLLSDCAFENNSALCALPSLCVSRGGGIALYQCENISLVRCSFLDNLSGEGGGAHFWACDNVELLNCSWVSNSTDSSTESFGGAVFLRDTLTVRFDNCLFEENSALYGGGAVYYNPGGARWGTYPANCPQFVNCVFWDNRVTQGTGSAIYATDFYTPFIKYPDLVDTVAPSISDPHQKIISCELPIDLPDWIGYDPPIISNCTFVENKSYLGYGGVIFVDGTEYGIPVTNCIFWNNDTPIIDKGTYATYESDYVSFCNVPDTSEYYPYCGNFSADPLFVDTENGEFRLLRTSPCIDMGRNTGIDVYGSVVNDYLGSPRGLDGDCLGSVFGYESEYDVGAFEYITPECCRAFHSADIGQDNAIDLSELLRVIQFYNSETIHCDATSEDGYAIGSGDTSCCPHSSDYIPQDWNVSVSELLRLVQFYNSAGYRYCPEEGSEDGFCPGVGAD